MLVSCHHHYYLIYVPNQDDNPALICLAMFGDPMAMALGVNSCVERISLMDVGSLFNVQKGSIADEST